MLESFSFNLIYLFIFFFFCIIQDIRFYTDLSTICKKPSETWRPGIIGGSQCSFFDVSFLIHEFRRCSVDLPSDWMFLDTCPLAREMKKLNGTFFSVLESVEVEKTIRA